MRFLVGRPIIILLMCGCSFGQNSGPAQMETSAPESNMPAVLYGAAYYNEYMPADLGPERLGKDVALMKEAGVTCVRMGESTWSLWEPSDGRFEYAWMDRVVDAMSKAGIKVIMGTPTYSIPTWLYREHPEILARPLGGAYVGYGMRQNMNYDDPVFRRYAQRLIVNLVDHYRDNPAVIGWQIDNETSSYGASNPDVFQDFVEFVKKKYGSTAALNKAWFLNYWGEDVNTWEDMPTRDNATSTSYKLEWSRFEQFRVTRYLAWQGALVREHRRPDQFVTTDFGSMMRPDVNEWQVAKSLDVIADNIYFQWQDHLTGQYQTMQGDFSRSLKHANFLVTETNAQTLGWDSADQIPPYDGQLRLDAYSHFSDGANLVSYWHWASIHAGQETYWKGVLGHDLEPNRAYAEVSRIGHELQKIGPEIADLQVQNRVAILYSVDSANALRFMPFKRGIEDTWTPGKVPDAYGTLVQQLHAALYHANVGTDFVFPEDPDFSRYKLLIVPALYIASDDLLKKIADYVQGGGNVLMTFKSGFANEDSAVRWERAPGPLRQAAGFNYQEFSTLEKPLSLKGDPFGVGAENQVSAWAEFIQPETAKALAFYDHPFFGRWPAITRNEYGKGTLTYEGTELSDALQNAVVLDELGLSKLLSSDQQLPAGVHVKHGVGHRGRSIHYYLNFSGAPERIQYAYPDAVDILTGRSLAQASQTSIEPWGVIIAEEVK